MQRKSNLIELAVKELIKNRAKSLVDLNAVKRKIARKFNISIVSNVELLKAYHNLTENGSLKTDKKIENVLKKRRVRSLSGVAIVSLLTKPYPCPGKCLYCPAEKGMPKSYLSDEPAVMRAVLNKFNPYLQVKNRLKSLEATGHPTDKIEIIVIGGTWSVLPEKYQTWFIKKCFDAANGRVIKNLAAAQKANEKAKHRIIGITVETRPDFINGKEIKRMRGLGVTRVELGVQSVFDDVLKINKRGHNIASTIKATKLLKDTGFKVCYHLMPNLPGSDLQRDIKMFKEIFRNPDFRPDLLKIYPCAVLKESPLYKLWKNKKYRPYKESELIKVLKAAKKTVPYYCRIQRLVRDIPSPRIAEGPAKISNIRQILAEKAKKENWRCRCIRCREVRENYDPKEKLYLYRENYEASGGKEIFLSYENKNRTRLYSLLRLRIPSQNQFLPVLQNAAIIREVHTYGQLHPLNDSAISPQHKGLGKKLIKGAEKIAKKEFRIKKIAVISGIGVRDYYRKQGYKLKDTYMINNF